MPSSALLVLTVCQAAHANGRTANPSGTPPPTPHVLVQAPNATAVAAVTRAMGVTIVDSDAESGTYLLTVPSGQSADQFAQVLAHNPLLTDAEPDVPQGTPEAGGACDDQSIHLAFDYKSNVTAYYDNIAASGGINDQVYSQVDLGNALSVTRGAGVTVAVIDTGVMASHPNLTSHLVPGYNEIAPGLAPDDAPDGVTNAAWGHGTMVTGIIVRLAPAARLMPIRVLNGDGTGSILNIVRGIEYAVDHGAQVLNLSLGGTKPSGVLQQAVRKAISSGVVVVAAAGNEGTSAAHYPASFPGVIGVGSVDPFDIKTTFSNYAVNVTLVAPGTGIQSTYINGGYASWTGTSFSAPIVTAAAALLLSEQPAIGGAGVSAQLLNTGRSIDALNPAYAGLLGSGELDIAAAVSATAPVTSTSN